MTSDKQVEANRRNAQLSTGPRTETGKVQSSSNAMRSGVYARTLRPIKFGPFAEDEQDLRDAVQEIQDALAPRDALEAVQAEQVAIAYLQAWRLDALEVAAAEGAAAIDAQRFVPDELNPVVHLQNLTALCDFLQNYDPPTFVGHAPFERFARVVNDFCREGRARVNGLWTTERVPKNEDEWRRVFDAFMDDFFGSIEEGIRYLTDRRDELASTVEIGQAVGKVEPADGLLDLMLKKTSVLRARTARAVLVQMAIYKDLQQRDLAGGG